MSGTSISTDADTARPWFVYDSNARVPNAEGDGFKPRIHEAGGKRYALRADKETPMPEAHARVFLKDPAFVVLDPDKNVVKPLEVQAMERMQPKRLGPEFVIAGVHELSIDALVTRCAQFQGAADFTIDTDRNVLQRFLVNAHKVADAANTAPDDAPDGRVRNTPTINRDTSAGEVEDEMSEADMAQAFQ